MDRDYVEVRLRLDDLERIHQNGMTVEVLTPLSRRTSFHIPTNIPRQFGYKETFQEILRDGRYKQ